MNAFEIVYTPNEDRVILGWPTGLIEVSEVNPKDGSPGKLITRLLHHKKEVVFVGVLSSGEIISVDAAGKIHVSDATTGKSLRNTKVGGEYISAALSPSKQTLFVYSYLDSDATLFAMPVSTLDVRKGPPEVDKHLSVSTRVFGISDTVAACHLLKDRWGKERKVHEGLVFVDFERNAVDVKVLAGAPESTFHSDSVLFNVNGAKKLGLRYCYEQPVEFREEEGGERIGLMLETFDIETGQRLQRLKAVEYDAKKTFEKEPEFKQLKAPNDSEEYLEARDSFLRRICGGKITEDGRFAWVSFKGGYVRRIALDGGDPTPVVVHGGTPKQNWPTLNDVFARNLQNNFTLGISPSGKYVGFSNPNEFFSIETVKLEEYEESILRLPMRAQAKGDEAEEGGAAEAPQFARFTADGRYLVVNSEAGFIFVVDAAKGKLLHTLEQEYGEINSVDCSADGKKLALAYSGSNSFIAELKKSPVMYPTPMPPHGVLAKFMGDKVIFAHHNGAVAVIDDKTMLALRSDDGEPAVNDEPISIEVDEDEDPEMIEGIYDSGFFEQHIPVYATAHFVHQKKDYVALVNEDSDLSIYRVEPKKLSFVCSESVHRGSMMTAGSGLIATLDDGEAAVYRFTGEGVEEVRTLKEDALHYVRLTESTGELITFNEQTGDFAVRKADGEDEGTVRLHYTGSALLGLDVKPEASRGVLVEGDGKIVLFDWSNGKVVACYQVRGSDEGRELAKVKDADVKLSKV